MVRPGAHVRRDELGDGGRIRVGEVEHGHATLVHHGLHAGLAVVKVKPVMEVKEM